MLKRKARKSQSLKDDAQTVPDVPDVAEKYFQQAMKNRRSAEYEDIIRITDYCNRFSYCK